MLIYKGQAIYTTTAGWLVWDGKRWDEDDLKAAALAMQLTDVMLAEALTAVRLAGDALTEAKVLQNKDAEEKAKKLVKQAESYRKHALVSRQKNRIYAMLSLAQSLLSVSSEKLDADPYALNTPGGIVDLRTGAILPHDPNKLCTKITKNTPGMKGYAIWAEHLDMISCGDKKLAGFLQQVAGMTAIGRVFEENLLIGIGDGKNGKSAHFNSQANRVRLVEQKALRKLRHPRTAKPLRAFIEERTNYYRHVGVDAFQRLRSSSVELEAIRREALRDYDTRGGVEHGKEAK